MSLVTEQDVYDYLGIDYADEMVERRVSALIATVNAYLIGAIGRDYTKILGPEEITQAREISLMVIGDLYDSRSISHKEAATAKLLFRSLLLQLQISHEGGMHE